MEANLIEMMSACEFRPNGNADTGPAAFRQHAQFCRNVAATVTGSATLTAEALRLAGAWDAKAAEWDAC